MLQCGNSANIIDFSDLSHRKIILEIAGSEFSFS